MGADLPTISRELLPLGAAQAVRRARLRAATLWPALLLLVGLGLAVLVAVSGTSASLRALPWALPPLAAGVAWAHAAPPRSAGSVRWSWWLFCSAAAVAVAGHLAWAYQVADATPSRVPTGLYILVLPHLLISLGAALVLGGRRGGWSETLLTDSVLVVLAAVVGLLRWVVEPLLVGPDGPQQHQLAVLAVVQSVAVVPVLPAWLVVLQRRSRLTPETAVLLLGATVLFAGSALLSLTGADPHPLVPGDSFEMIGLSGWLLLAASGIASANPPATPREMLRSSQPRDRLRKLLVPGTALFLGLVAVDVGLGSQPRPETVAALALLGAVLSLRTAQAFSMVDREAERRVQLVRTQTLVEVTHSLAGTTDLDETLRVISDSARTVLGTQAAGVELVSNDGRELVTRAAVGLPGELLGMRFSVEDSFTGWVVRHGEPRTTVDPTQDPYIQPSSLRFLGQSPLAAAPIQFRGETLGVLFACIRVDPFEPDELHLMGALAEQAAIAIKNARLFEQVTHLSITDPLTGLPNRRQLERELARDFAAAGRGRELVAVIFDLDNFKEYNDTHGHLAGDEALQAFARSLETETRAMNLAARYGGDEFVALLGDSDMAGAATFVERVQQRFRTASVALGRREIEASAGIAEWRPGMQHPDELLREADNRLYRSKSRVRM